MRGTTINHRTHQASCLMNPVESYLLGGRLPVFRLVLFAQEEAGHLHLGSTAMGDVAVTSRFARGGLNLGVRFAWSREREKPDSLTRPLEGAGRPTLSDSYLPPPASNSPGVLPGVRPALWDLLAARMGEGAGPVASFALRCQRAIGALGMGASS